MSPLTASIKDDNKFPLLLRQGLRSRRLCNSQQVQRGERMQRWQHRLERLFARQVY